MRSVRCTRRITWPACIIYNLMLNKFDICDNILKTRKSISDAIATRAWKRAIEEDDIFAAAWLYQRKVFIPNEMTQPRSVEMQELLCGWGMVHSHSTQIFRRLV